MRNSDPVPAEFDASGVFETCRVRRAKILHLEEHLMRLRASLNTLEITGWVESDVRSRLTQAAQGIIDGYVRIAVRRGREPRIVVHRREGLPYSKRQFREGISLRTVPTRWPAGESTWAQVKLSERLPSILARMEAPEVSEVLRVGQHGYVTEGTVSNLFFVKEGGLITASSFLGILEGVTRSRVIRAAGKLKIPVHEIPFTRHDLFNAEEVFLTSALMSVLPVRQVDGRRIGAQIPGPITRHLMRMITE